MANGSNSGSATVTCRKEREFKEAAPDQFRGSGGALAGRWFTNEGTNLTLLSLLAHPGWLSAPYRRNGRQFEQIEPGGAGGSADLAVSR